MNIYPNTQCALYCAWILANSNIRVTTARKIQIQTVQTAANTGGYVAQLYYEEFIAYTSQWYLQYQQYLAQQPSAPQPATYDPLTTAWLATVTTPALQTIYSVDVFFKQLRADGNLAIDYLFLFAQDQQANARISLFNPTLYNATEHNTPTWTANQGYTGNGSNMYLSLNFIDNTNGVNFASNNASMGCYLRQSVGTTNKINFGTYAGNSTYISATFITGIFYANIQSSTYNSSIGSVGTQGLFTSVRTGSTATQQWVNGLQVKTGTDASTGLNNIQDYVLAGNNGGTPAYYDTNQNAMIYKGSGALKQNLLNSAINLLMTNLGAHY